MSVTDCMMAITPRRKHLHRLRQELDLTMNALSESRVEGGFLERGMADAS